jgi:hypothetical protein
VGEQLFEQGMSNRQPSGSIPFSVPTKEHATGNQISILLDIVGTLTSRLESAEASLSNSSNGGRLDGEAKIAIETTLIKALTALDSIVEQKGRWDVSNLVQLEKDSRNLIKANIKFLKEQAASTAHVRRPSFRFNPRLVRVKSGGFAAIFGDDLTTAVIGQGDTIEAALRDFDKVCNREFKQTQQIQNENEQQRKMDAGTIDATPIPPSGGKDGAGDIKSPRRRRVSRAQQTRPPGGTVAGDDAGKPA